MFSISSVFVTAENAEQCAVTLNAKEEDCAPLKSADAPGKCTVKMNEKLQEIINEK